MAVGDRSIASFALVADPFVTASGLAYFASIDIVYIMELSC